MPPTHSLYDPSTMLWRPLPLRVLFFLLRALAEVVLVLAVFWGTLALYYELNTFTAFLFLIVNAATLILARPRWKGLLFFLLTLAIVLLWLTGVNPSNDRPWESTVAVAPTATIEGEKITIHNLRDFDFTGAGDFKPRYREASYALSQLQSLDLFVCRGGSAFTAQTLLSFGFSTGEYVCISAEPRLEKDEPYSAIKNFFRQHELFFLAAEERDAVRLRANFLGEKVRVYRLQATPAVMQKTLLDYLHAMNGLAAEPQFYNALLDHYAGDLHRFTAPYAARSPWNWRLLFTGYLDKLAYDHGALDRSLSFADLKSRSLINEASRLADKAPDYSAKIRAGRPGF